MAVTGRTVSRVMPNVVTGLVGRHRDVHVDERELVSRADGRIPDDSR
jgi:hypothetical protein